MGPVPILLRPVRVSVWCCAWHGPWHGVCRSRTSEPEGMCPFTPPGGGFERPSLRFLRLWARLVSAYVEFSVR